MPNNVRFNAGSGGTVGNPKPPIPPFPGQKGGSNK